MFGESLFCNVNTIDMDLNRICGIAYRLYLSPLPALTRQLLSYPNLDFLRSAASSGFNRSNVAQPNCLILKSWVAEGSFCVNG